MPGHNQEQRLTRRRRPVGGPPGAGSPLPRPEPTSARIVPPVPGGAEPIRDVSDRAAIAEGTSMRVRRLLLVAVGAMTLAGCTDGGSGHAGVPSDGRFYADDWIYYDDDDEAFLAELSDEQKEALKREWESLPDE